MKKYLNEKFMDELWSVLEDYYVKTGRSKDVYQQMANLYNSIEDLNEEYWRITNEVHLYGID